MIGQRVLPQSILEPLQSTQRLLVARVVTWGSVVLWLTFFMMSSSQLSGFVGCAVGLGVRVMV